MYNLIIGIFERSDAMLANYPGDGARFARHIDNTTGSNNIFIADRLNIHC